LTPLNSAGGGIPETVTTDENGVAQFDLQYLKESAGFIYDAISASTVVQGSETRATKRFWLGASESDITGCYLGDSPFNAHWKSLSAVAGISTVLVSGSTTVTVTVLYPDGSPVVNQLVSSQILVDGTNNTMSPTVDEVVAGSGTTDAFGVATFTYTAGDQAGSDNLMFYFIDGPAIIADYMTIVAE
jgi:hypothetical protein